MPSCPLRIYSDREYLPPGMKHCLLLIPFWGEYHEHDGYSKFAREGPQFLQMTPPHNADVAVLPFDGQHLLRKHGPDQTALSQAKRFVETARAAGLKTIIILNSDSNEPVRLPDTLVFRTSLNRRSRLPNEFALPAWHEDLLQNHLGGSLAIRDWNIRPVVSFCGHAAPSKPPLRRRAKILIQKLGNLVNLHIEHNDGLYLRRQAMQTLENDPTILTNFIVRQDYFGGGLGKTQVFQQIRTEYIMNMVDSDYVLCIRGYGNFSFRFFEAMSVGRAPLLLDTDCVLPYDFLHDYRQLCVIAPEGKMKNLGQTVMEFHQSYTPGTYGELQRRIRDFWRQWLSPEGFFRNLPHHWTQLHSPATSPTMP